MANLKKLIGNALNKAKSSKPSDDGYKTRKLKGMSVKQGMDYSHKQNIEIAEKGINIAKENLFKAKNPGFNPNVPASTKTTKPAPIQAAIDKRNKEQAKWNDPYTKGDVMGVSNNPKYGGGGGSKYVESPAKREYNAREIKRVTSPGGLKKELTQFDRSLGTRRKDKFKND